MKTKLIQIDGSAGEGGGQILRTSLALSLVTGKPFRIERIRAGRQKPGLMRQHLTAVNAAVEIGGAAVDGAEIGSQELIFHPGPVKPGAYRFAVGTAGSATLVLQTVLPALLVADEPSVLNLEGGTHNPLAPPFDFLERAFLPVVGRMGAQVEADLLRPGFFPAGGGQMQVRITPCSKLQPVEILERGGLVSRSAQVIIAGLPDSIAERQRESLKRSLGWPAESITIERESDQVGPGNVVLAELSGATHTEIFSAFGQRGVRSEQVVDHLVKSVRDYLTHGAPVGEYLADQMLIPMALAGGGSFRTGKLSRHSITNMDVIRRFLDTEFEVTLDSPLTEQLTVR
ncbi:MAG: 3-phosphate cyclase, class [Verrucomicrobiota bacterium]